MYFVSFAVVNGIDAFVRPSYKHLIVENLKYRQKEKGLGNICLHLIIGKQGKVNIQDTLRDFKKYTSKRLTEEIHSNAQESRRILWDLLSSRYFYRMGDYTPPIEDNLLGISDREKLNEEEARGIILAEEFMYDLDESVEIDTPLVLQLHQTAFGHLYDWAGKWRTNDFKVGQHIPPSYQEVPTLMYQFLDELSFKLKNSSDKESLISTIAYAHHRMVKIHPFVNGNGRTARLLSDLISILNGYDQIILYHREGKARQTYLETIRAADQYDYSKLEELIRKQLKPLK